jgi:hypothetical protein
MDGDDYAIRYQDFDFCRFDYQFRFPFFQWKDSSQRGGIARDCHCALPAIASRFIGDMLLA